MSIFCFQVVFTGGLSCLAAIIVSFVGAKTLIQVRPATWALSFHLLINNIISILKATVHTVNWYQVLTGLWNI